MALAVRNDGLCYNQLLQHPLVRKRFFRTIGEWLSLVEHLVRDQGVGGSNPLSPIRSIDGMARAFARAFHLWAIFVDMRKGFTRKPQADEPATRVKNYITPDGLQRLKDEHRFLLTRERPAVTKVVTWAASNGDRSENA